MKSIREIFDLRHRKALRIAVLVLSTLLIGTVSALTYYSISASITATTTAAKVQFVAGGDTPAGYTISAAGTFAKISISGYPNATLTYQRGLNVSNTDTASHLIRLRNIQITGGQGSYSNATSKIEFDLFSAGSGGSVQASLTFKGANAGNPWTTTPVSGATAYVTIPASTVWTIQIITVADAAASTGVVTGIQMSVDVQ